MNEVATGTERSSLAGLQRAGEGRRSSVPIEDYALIGDCRAAALVSKSGSLDWLCWPRFDSPPIFGALLDPERGGAWSVAVRGSTEARRRYVDDSAVLETTLETEAGSVVLTDVMPIADAEDAKRLLLPEHELIRIIECKRGVVTVDVRLAARPDFGRTTIVLRKRGKLGIRIETRHGLLTLRSDAPEPACLDDGLTWRLELRAGDVVNFSLTWTMDAPAIIPPLGEWTRQCVERTLRHWQVWSARTSFEGPERAQVVRSAITVRLLAYAPSGAIVAAPTTSLPETLDGDKNWDYRYCWLRDAAFTVRGLLELGHVAEASGFAHWLLHATRMTQPRLMVLYDVFGRQPVKEAKLGQLAGYAGSRPVRIGNGADDQVQLDSYGEVIDAVWRITRAGVDLDRETCGVLEALGRYVCQHWSEPDAGIWEPRGEPRQHTHSIALCWTALDRLIDLQASGHLRRHFAALFQTERAAMAEALQQRAFNVRRGAYTSELDGESLDATALLLGWYGYEQPSSARMRSTFERLTAELSPRPGLLYRNRAPGDDEGAFGVCSFWISEHLAKGGGSLAAARQAFSETVSFVNDVGLLAEEIDPHTGRALGNFPQTFSHVGLINAALSLSSREREDANR